MACLYIYSAHSYNSTNNAVWYSSCSKVTSKPQYVLKEVMHRCHACNDVYDVYGFHPYKVHNHLTATACKVASII